MVSTSAPVLPGTVTLNSWLPAPTPANVPIVSKVPPVRTVVPPTVTVTPVAPWIRLRTRTLAPSSDEFPQPPSRSAIRQPAMSSTRVGGMDSP
jgi:hypothetical protein